MMARMMRNGGMLLMGVLLSGITALAQSEETSLQITLDTPAHFLSPDAQDVLLPAGAYLLEEAIENSLRVVAIPEMEATLIQAVAMKHNESIETSIALSTQEQEEEDHLHLVLLLPDGQGWQAIGSYSGIQKRGTASGGLSSQAIRKSLSVKRETPGPRIPINGRQVQTKPSGESPPSSRFPGGALSTEKVRDLEGQRDQLKKIAKGKSIEALTRDFLDQEKFRVKKENALLTKTADLLKTHKMPSIPDPCPKPQVESKSVAIPIEPHEEIILNGCGFGDKRGELRLVSNAFPGGHVKLDVLTWTRKAIHARMPALQGVKNAFKAQMLVVRLDLTLGDSFLMPFRATHSCELIKRPRLSVTCAESGACDFCLDCLKEKWGDFSFGGYHNPSPRINAGIDKASVNLGNDWYLQGMDYQWDDARYFLHGTHVIVGVPQGFKMKARKFTIKVPWTAWQMGEVRYVVKLLACGPWGVPY